MVCDTKTDSIDVLPNVPDDINPASAVWTPEGNGVVAIGYTITPRKLGLIYCSNRPSHIFSLTLNGQYGKFFLKVFTYVLSIPVNINILLS